MTKFFKLYYAINKCKVTTYIGQKQDWNIFIKLHMANQRMNGPEFCPKFWQFKSLAVRFVRNTEHCEQPNCCNLFFVRTFECCGVSFVKEENRSKRRKNSTDLFVDDSKRMVETFQWFEIRKEFLVQSNFSSSECVIWKLVTGKRFVHYNHSFKSSPGPRPLLTFFEGIH